MTIYADAAARLTRALAPAADLPVGAPLALAIVPTSAYHQPGDPTGPYQYGRFANPTWTAVEDVLAQVEEAEVVGFPSGMAAVAGVLYPLLKPKDVLLLPSDGYFTVRLFAERYLVPQGIDVRTCPTRDMAQADVSGCTMVWIETPSNPGLDLADIAQIAARAHAAGARVVVDNTTMTPLGQRPLMLGADLLVSADTKAVNGHSDALFGHVASTDSATIALVREWRKLSGAIPGAHDAWAVHRGLATLELRFERMCANAQVIAERLMAHDKVRAVAYPGLISHPAYALGQVQMLRSGFLITLTLADRAQAERFIQGATLLRQATSFGGTHSSAERRQRWGDPVADGFIRLSVGCEPVELLWTNLSDALDAA